MCIFKALYRRQKYKREKARIGNLKLNLIVADTFIKKAIGLMYRKSIGRSEGMLFKFGRDGYNGIWMKNMLFSIDIIWLDRDGKIVDYVEDAKPCRKTFGCEVYKPRSKARYIIEVNSGFVKKSNVKMGDRFIFSSE